jgi:hypothetical protein
MKRTLGRFEARIESISKAIDRESATSEAGLGGLVEYLRR